RTACLCLRGGALFPLRPAHAVVGAARCAYVAAAGVAAVAPRRRPVFPRIAYLFRRRGRRTAVNSPVSSARSQRLADAHAGRVFPRRACELHTARARRLAPASRGPCPRPPPPHPP